MSLLLLQLFVCVLALSITDPGRRGPTSASEVQAALEELNRTLEQRVAERSAAAEQRAEQLARSEGACRDQARTLQSILDNILEGVVVADDRGKFVLWNPAAERLVGDGQQDIPLEQWPSHYGCFLPDQVTPYPADRVPLARALRGETVQAEDMFLCNASRPDGVWLRLSAVPLRDGEGEPVGGVVVFRDVSESKQAELRLRSVIESALAGFVMVDEAGRIALVNRQAEVIFGYTREELDGQSIEVLVPEHLREDHRRHIGSYFRDPQKPPDGRLAGHPRPPQGWAHRRPPRRPEPHPTGWATLHPRLRPRRHRAEAGRRPGPVGRRVLAGRHRRGRSGRPDRPGEPGGGADVRLRREELLGQPLGILVPERDRDHHQELCRQVVAERRQRSMNRGRDLFARRKDGSEFPADIALHSYELHGEGFAVANVRDMTERHRLMDILWTNLLIQDVTSQVLRTSLEPSGVDEQLRRSLELILSVPWFATPARGGIFLAEGDNAPLVLKAQHGLPPEFLSRCAALPPGQCLCGHAAPHREIVFTGGPDERPDSRHPGQPPHGLYCVPILESEGHGIIGVFLEEPHPRRPEEEEFLSSAARILAGSLERKRAEGALRQSEARFRAISEAAPLGIFLTDARGDCLYTNRAYLELTGRDAGEPLGDCWKEIIHPEDRDRVTAAWYRAARDRLPFELTYRFVHRDGRTIWVSGKSAQIRVGDALTGYVGVVEDITQKREAIEAIRRSEERFDLAVRGTDAGIWDWDLRTGTVYFSPRWKSMLGYAEDEVRDAFSEWESRVHPDDRDRASRAIQAYLEGRSAEYELEHRLRHKDGTYRWILARGAAVRDRQGRPSRMVGSHIDITVQKRTAAQLNERLVQLRAAQKIQQTLLPKRSPALDGLDIAGFSVPAAYAGGDMFDYLTMVGGHLGVVVGDVSGHGIGAALQMASTLAFLRSLAQTCATIGEIMTRLNGFVYEGTEEDFVTLVLTRIDLKARTLTYANAGHPPGYVLDAAGDVRAELSSSTIPLGIEGHLDFPVGAPIALGPGDLVVLVTDGILEAESPEGILFGEDRLLELIRYGAGQVQSRDRRGTPLGGWSPFRIRDTEGRLDRRGHQGE